MGKICKKWEKLRNIGLKLRKWKLLVKMEKIGKLEFILNYLLILMQTWNLELVLAGILEKGGIFVFRYYLWDFIVVFFIVFSQKFGFVSIFI